MDKRTKEWKQALKEEQRIRQIMWTVIFGILAGIVLALSFLREMDKPRTLISPIAKEQEKPVVQKILAKETPCDYDPITYLRCRGQQLGINEYQITKIIKVMKCESGLRADAINKNTNGTYDLGVGQINDVHNKRISREDRLNFVKNIDFIYKLYQEQGLNPWVCARKLALK
jgi:hypothetical protein